MKHRYRGSKPQKEFNARKKMSPHLTKQKKKTKNRALSTENRFNTVCDFNLPMLFPKQNKNHQHNIVYQLYFSSKNQKNLKTNKNLTLNQITTFLNYSKKIIYPFPLLIKCSSK